MRTPVPSTAAGAPRSWIAATLGEDPLRGYEVATAAERKIPSAASGRIATHRGPRAGRRLVAAEAPRGESREEGIVMYAEPARGAALVPALPLLSAAVDTIIVTTTMTGVEDDVVTGRARPCRRTFPEVSAEPERSGMLPSQ